MLDVCARTGLSTATISRVLNKSPNVRPETRNRVLKAIDELGYRRNHAATSLARQRTDTIGVIFPHIASGFYSEVLEGINEVAAANGRHLMVAFSRGTDDEPEVVEEYLQAGRVDGMILMNLGMPEAFIRRVAGRGVPLVLIDRPVPTVPIPTVEIDNVAGAEAAMAHLLEHGYRRIVVICGPERSFDATQRLIGCRRAAEAAGHALDEASIWRGRFTDRSGYELMADWLDRGRPLPEAVFALNDAMAVGVMDALRERGLGVPDHMALVGFDDFEAARYLGLTTVHSPMRRMGRLACELAVAQMDRDAERGESVLPTELIVRTSCGCKEPGRRRAGRATETAGLNRRKGGDTTD